MYNMLSPISNALVFETLDFKTRSQDHKRHVLSLALNSTDRGIYYSSSRPTRPVYTTVLRSFCLIHSFHSSRCRDQKIVNKQKTLDVLEFRASYCQGWVPRMELLP